MIRAQDLNMVGLNLLRAVATNVDGTGVRVAQVEATETAGATNFEVNPGTAGVASNLFTYISGAGVATNFPNSVGGESTHAHDVGVNFYGPSIGLATNVAHVDNYYADYFAQTANPPPFFTLTVTLPSTNINDAVVNQSFVFGNEPSTVTVGEQQILDTAYDNYAAQYNTLFVSAANNADSSVSVSPPGTAYNCISVGAYASGGVYYNSIGPTLDNGRAKPDITAPAGATSYSTPQIAGAAADLIGAGRRGDGGSDTNSAADPRTVKALLLNGAVKPLGWTNSNSSPLDARYGAGVVNILNSYEQLAAGKHGYNFATNIPTGTAHPPVAMTNSVAALSGWDFNTNNSSSVGDGVNHYFFNVSNSVSSAKFFATATLVWNRHQNQSGINNLNLYLYNAANSSLVACSTSLVDNVEHIYKTNLLQGRYDLQVLKKGGASVSTSETYALAWGFFTETAKLTRSGTNVAVVWPVYPAGFLVETATNLATPNWIALSNLTAVVTNNQNQLILSATNNYQFFRLRMPNL